MGFVVSSETSRCAGRLRSDAGVRPLEERKEAVCSGRVLESEGSVPGRRLPGARS